MRHEFFRRIGVSDANAYPSPDLFVTVSSATTTKSHHRAGKRNACYCRDKPGGIAAEALDCFAL